MSYQFARGAWTACLSAGPVFVATLLFSAVLESPAAPLIVGIHWGEIVGGALVIIMPVILIGMLLAFFPVWLGSNLLAWVGTGNIGVRHPAFWAIAGGATAAIPMAVSGADTIWPFGAALVATGAICAVIARYGTRWSDDSV